MIIDVFFTILLCVLIGGGSLIAALAMISGACSLIREIIHAWRDIRR